MSTTDTTDTTSGYRAPPPSASPRLLRRSRVVDRVGAGVCGGMGEYFGFDPVLFRVLFATAAFVGGSGVLGYLLAWAVIPDAAAPSAPVDAWLTQLRRRRGLGWVVAVTLGLLLWVVTFRWWAPGPVIPLVAVVVLLVFLFGRRDLQGRRSDPVSLTKDGSPTPSAGSWVSDVRAWTAQVSAAARVRRRRALPIKIAALGGLVLALVVIAALDAITGVPMVTYSWAGLGFVVAGLLVGLVTRRTPWILTLLLLPSAAGVLAFGGSHAGLHDGVGQATWNPAGAPAAQYRLGLGSATLDLRSLPLQTPRRLIRVTVGAGQVRVIVPKSRNITVRASVHLGQVSVTGAATGSDRVTGGVGISRVAAPPRDSDGPTVVVDVHLADGTVVVDRR